MVLGCDIVIAVDTARFGLPEARVGRMPLDGGMVLLQRKIPFNRAMAVMLIGRQFGARRWQAMASSMKSCRPQSWMRLSIAGSPTLNKPAPRRPSHQADGQSARRI